MSDNTRRRKEGRSWIQYVLAVALLVLTAAGGLTANAGDSPVQDKYGSLAIDSNQGSLWGWAVDYADQGEADSRALRECQERGGRCSVVMRFHNACAAYAADQAKSSTAYGWAWSKRDRATAERLALEECAAKRGGAGSNCIIRVWGCTTRSVAADDSGEGLESVRFEVGQRFRDCADCPEMVVVPSGSFMMGSPSHEERRVGVEGPVHRVRIGEPFAVGVYEVTFAEWDACVAGGGCGGHRPDDEGWGRDRQPVRAVSWADAQLYVEWLSRGTGERYRLLSESEWEYVARAGTTTPFHTGSTISTDQANYNGKHPYSGGGENRKRTVPVGSFGANGFGLHDVHGNVLEWVQDCWNGSYAGAPSDGSAWESGDCSRRGLRDGFWLDDMWSLRSARRGSYFTDRRYSYYGFRVARTLTP